MAGVGLAAVAAWGGGLPVVAQPGPAGAPGGATGLSAAPSVGFAGVEIYKVNDGASHLRCVDVDGDGLMDIVVVSNSRATIDFFLQKTPAEIAASQDRPVEFDNINEIASDARFKKETHLTEKRVFDLVVDDLNGDGRPDLAYYGDPRELVVVPRTPRGWSDKPRRFPIAEARASGRGLAAGDLNGDGRKDLVLLGTDKTYLFFQGPDGNLNEPVEIPNSEKDYTAVTVADLDGDGRQDLFFFSAGQIEPFRVRLQGPGGLGAEIAIETSAPRSHLVTDVTGCGHPEIAVVQEATGRLIVFRLESVPTEDGAPLGRIRLFPLRAGEDAARRSVTLGDVDGDGRTDVLVTYPGSAQFQLFRQGGTGDLLPPETFPTLASSSGTQVGDLDGDGRAAVVVLSAEEKAIGVTRWDGARLAFPKSLPLKSKPVCCALANVDGRKGDELAVVVEDDGGKRILFFAHGDPLAPLGEGMKLEGAKDAPERIVFFDANQDGRLDLLAFFPYESVRVYLHEGGEPGALPRFADVSDRKDFGRGLLQGAAASSFAGGDPDGDGKSEFFLAKKSFARALRVTPAGALEVVDQFNAPDAAADVVGVACADLAGDGRPEVALLDKSKNQLWVLARGEKKTFEASRAIRLPAFRYRGLSAADLNGDGRLDLFVPGDDRFGVLYAKGSNFRLRPVAQYECELKDARLDLMAAGDLSGDGRVDLVVSELHKHLLEVLSPELGPAATEPRSGQAGMGTLARATRFKVFEDRGREGRMAMMSPEGSREPRDIAIADVTGDKKADVVLLIHDRILVYPQE